jgi:hypothetical protein
VSIAGVLGGLGGLGIDLLIQPGNEKVQLGIPLAGSILGLGIGIAATRTRTPREALGAGPEGALVGLSDGRLAFGMPAPTLTVLPPVAGRRSSARPGLGIELFRAEF